MVTKRICDICGEEKEILYNMEFAFRFQPIVIEPKKGKPKKFEGTIWGARNERHAFSYDEVCADCVIRVRAALKKKVIDIHKMLRDSKTEGLTL